MHKTSILASIIGVVTLGGTALAGVDAQDGGYATITRVLAMPSEDYTVAATSANLMLTVDVDHQTIGGNQDVCAQVINPGGAVQCWADDSTTGGSASISSLDPTLTCVLGATGIYRIRVFLFDGDCSDTSYGTLPDGSSFYRLHVYLSKQALAGSQVGAAAVQSKNLIVVP